jgi:hypothetical protein
MIKFHINRTYEKFQTKGNLSIHKEGAAYKCLTLELPWKLNKSKVSCIPEGTYPVKIRYSQKYGTHLHIQNVPNRDLILIHWANYVGSVNPKSKTSDLMGCVGVGESYGDITKDGIDELLNSKNVFNKMMSFVKDELGEMEIEISGNGGQYSPES